MNPWCGTSVRPHATTSSSPRGSSRTTVAPGCSGFAGRSRPEPDSSNRPWRSSSGSWATRACSASRSGSTSSNCRSSSRCKRRASRFATPSRPCSTRARSRTQDELMLLSQAAAMVDGVYQDIFEALKPGVRENEIVALANKRLYEMGSDQVEAINAVSGERCNPHPAQLHRPDHPTRRPGVLRHHPLVQRLPDLLLPHAVGRQFHQPSARRLHPGARVDGRGDRPRASRGRHRRDRAVVAGGDRVRLRRTRWPPSVCSSDTASVWACTSDRSSAA